MTRYLLVLLAALAAAPTLVATSPVETLWIADDRFDAFIALDDPAPVDREQWASWSRANARPLLPDKEGHYLVFTREFDGRVYTLFFGPYSGPPEVESQRLQREIAEAMNGEPSLLAARVRVIDSRGLSEIRRLGVADWTRIETLAASRVRTTIAEAVREASRQPDGTGLSATLRTQLVALRNAQVLGGEFEDVAGRTLGADDAAAMDLALGRHFVGLVAADWDVERLRREGLDASNVEGLVGAIVRVLERPGEIDALGWFDPATGSWAVPQVRDLFSPGETFESMTGPQVDAALRGVGRVLVAAASYRWDLPTAEVLAPTPGVRQLERVSDLLAESGDLEGARIIREALRTAGEIAPDWIDIGQALAAGLQNDPRWAELDARDLAEGRKALVRKSRERSGEEITPSEFDAWLESGTDGREMQRVADIAREMIGLWGIVAAVGGASKSSDASTWTPEEVRDAVARIGRADRMMRLAEALEAEHDQAVDLSSAVSEGVSGEKRQELARALGEVAGAAGDEAAEQRGEEILSAAGAAETGGVDAAAATAAVEAAAAEGGQQPHGEPGDGSHGESLGGDGDGDGSDNGSGAIPLQSLPVLEMIARLVGQYFGVEAYLRQAAMLVYLFAEDAVKELVDKLAEVNDLFGDDLQRLASGVNSALDELGPYLADIGALAEAAIEQGFERARQELVELVSHEFEEEALDRLKNELAKELNVDPTHIDLDAALGLASDFSMEALVDFAEDTVEDAARQATNRLLADTGLPPELASFVDERDWDGAGRLIVERLEAQATREVGQMLGLPPEVAGRVFDSATRDQWDAVGDELLRHGTDAGFEQAAELLGVQEAVLRDPASAIEKTRSVVRETGALVAVLQDEVGKMDLRGLRDRAKQEASTIAGEALRRRVERDLDVIEDPAERAAIEAVLSGDAPGAVAIVQRRVRSDLEAAVSPLAHAWMVAAGVTDADTARLALTELADQGVLALGRDELALLRTGGVEAGVVLRRNVIAWAADRLPLGFNGSECEKALAESPDDTSRVRRGCTAWLDAPAEPNTIADLIGVGDEALRRIRDEGDADAVVSTLLLYAMRVGGKAPAVLTAGHLEAAARDGVPTVVARLAETEARKHLDRIRARVNPSALGRVLEALRTEDPARAAQILLDHRHDAAIQEWAPPEVKRILDEGQSRQEVLERLVAHYDPQRLAANALDIMQQHPETGSFGAAARCALGLSTPEGVPCEEANRDLRRMAIERGLAGQDQDMVLAVVDGDPQGIVQVTQGRIELTVRETLGDDPFASMRCPQPPDPGCVFRETQLIPALRESFPRLGEEAARRLVVDAAFDLGELKALASDLGGPSAPEALLNALGVGDGSAIATFGNSPNALEDPAAGGQLFEGLVGETFRAVTGEEPGTELLERMRTGVPSGPEPQCVEVLLRVFEPDGTLAPGGPIVPAPARIEPDEGLPTGQRWMIPGPLSSIGGSAKLAIPDAVRRRVGAGTPGAANTCYLTDGRGFRTDPQASSRAWLKFLVRIGEDRALLDPSDVERGTHPTVAIDCATGRVLDRSRADIDSIRVEPGSSESEVVQVQIQIAAGNPHLAAPLRPLSELSGTFIYRRDTFTASFEGRRETFPAHEGYVRLNGGDWQTLFRASPEPGATPFSTLDLGLFDTRARVAGEVKLPPYSAACRVPPSDHQRRTTLAAFAKREFAANQNDCKSFARTVEESARTAPNLTAWFEDLRLVLVGADWQRRPGKRGSYYMGRVGDSGFKAELQDGSPQVEHAWAAIHGAWLGPKPLPGLVGAAGSILDDSPQDRELYRIGGDIGERVSQPTMGEVGEVIRRTMCR